MKVLFTALFLLTLSAPSWAATCGPGQVNSTCQCGDTVSANYTLPADLSCPTGHGLRIASGKTLDCNWHMITGANVNNTNGIYFDGVTQAQALNCQVYHFNKGVRFNGGGYNVFENGESAYNGDFVNHVGYGVSFDGAATFNVLNNVQVYGNADEGVHVGTGAHNNVISSNHLCGNYIEDMYVLDANHTVIVNNSIGGNCFGSTQGGGGNTIMYIKNGIGTFVYLNYFTGGSSFNVHVTGASTFTVFRNNAVSSPAPTYTENCYSDGTCPSGTRFVNSPEYSWPSP